MEEITLTIPKAQYDGLIAYFNETSLDIFKLYKKIGRQNTNALTEFTAKHCTDETVKK